MNARVEPLEAFQPFGEDHGPHLTGAFAPVFDELELSDLPLVKGRIPSDLNGVYMRTGPNPRFAPQGRYHPFDGDGMIHAAQFERGRLTYRNRWVRTEGFVEEEGAGEARFHGIRETLKGRDDKRLKDSGNTDLVGHAGKALALWYMSGEAWEFDPITLETLGKSAAITQTGGAISAHAKVDEITGELMFFDYGLEAPYMSYGVLAADGSLAHHVPIALPGPRLPHDMAITEHYSILHDLPLFHNHEALKLGRHKIEFHPEMSTRLGVIARHGAGDSIRWFDFSPCFLYHVVNAWEESREGGDWIVMVGCRYMPARQADGTVDAPRTARDVAELVQHARLWRWAMNLKTGQTQEQPLDAERNVEFPTFNAALAGRRTRFGYLCDQREDVVLQWPGIRKYDLDSGEMLSAWSDDREHSWYSEPWFAAADEPQSEDHGYVIAFQWNAATRQQTLDIFDARDLSRGPVAQVALPRHIPTGFHGCWIAASRIAGWGAR
ncbi:carotenoid oxygenase family protein [Roseateles toxinivorans]|uniref:Carotenoid cleavage dioxygenase n=1 Tax=Roseateles toxinivorans TaxID=270368 RepID=A0A4R6QFS3_9BURK|nr:carotenoid oxygenase family protein [Roseateles toxinivorans]TDP61637.1 carotenoid cleavage dioxygenase [Roseateles toxinivorans]